MQLPVFEIADSLRAAVLAGDRSRVLLKAPTGSGKSTSVPGMLVDAGISGMILVIEPRRMAARLLAGWVAKQRGATLGREVGYAVRFDTKYRDDTRILYLTDGVFQRWIQDDPDLPGIGAVVFDEFHERRLAVDIALARCLDLQDGPRPDLRVVVMSATLETAGLADFLAPATALEAGGRIYPVDVLYRPDRPPVNDRRGGPPREIPIWEKMAAVCREAMAMPDAGNILMFLPGTHEIRRTIELLEQGSSSRGWDIFPLYSSLPPAAQDAAITPGPKPKIIVATNVAETSLTIDGVRTVIDSGLARIASYEPRRAINTLLIKKISRGDEGRGVFHAGLVVEFALAPADEAAGQGALVHADREVIAEAGEHRMTDGFAACFEIDRLPLPAEAGRQGAEAVEALSGLARAAGEDAKLAAALRIEFHRLGGFEGAPFSGEIRVVIGEDEILATHTAALVGENALALHRGGDEGGFRDAAVFVAGEHQPGEARL